MTEQHLNQYSGPYSDPPHGRAHFTGSAQLVEGAKIRPLHRTVTQEMVNLYAEASGDHNPVHLDEDYAKQTRYGKRITHGMLVLGIISEAMEHNFGGVWARSGELKAQFRNPVFPGETVAVDGHITLIENSPEVKVVYVTGSCLKGDGTNAVTFKCKVKIAP